MAIKSARDRLDQADHNEQARTALRDPAMHDWRVTMTFYAALHRVGAHFHAIGMRTPSGHSETRSRIARHVPEIAEAYSKLCAPSTRARCTEGAEVGTEQEDEAAGFYAQVAAGMRRRTGERDVQGGRAD